MRSRAGRRAWDFEEKLNIEKGSELAQVIEVRKKKRALRGKDVLKWEREKVQVF